MIKKITTILLAATTFVSSISISAFAETTSEAIVSVTYTEGSTSMTNSYKTVDEWIRAMPTYTTKKPTYILLKPVTISAEYFEFGGQTGGSDNVVDLNGYTLTLDNATLLALSDCTIKNGTIKTTAMLVSMSKGENDYDNSIFENVTVESSVGNVILPGAGNFQLRNCQMNIANVMYGGETGATGHITLESGSYKGLDTENLPTGVQLGSDSKQTTVYGVDATVITSPSTKAIVVKDGMAYTYDTVEAAKAAHPSEKLLVKDASGNFAEEAKKDVTWQTDTDSGVYQGSGMVRFLFNVDIDASSITESGIKCVKSGDITDASSAPLIGDHGTAKAFYADITDIAKDSTDTFYAMAYVKVGETIYWSNVVDAAVNTDNEFTSID